MTTGKALLFALVLLTAQAPGALAAGPQDAVGRFAVHADTAMPARTISFGQVFLPGTVRREEALQVLLDGKPTDTQVDPKAFNPDGSVRHAVMTIELPKMGSGQAFDATIIKGTAGAPAPAPMPNAAAVPALEVSLAIKGQNNAVQNVTVSLPAIAANPQNAVPGSWINGPLAQERRYRTDVNNRLQILFDVFVPKNGPARVDVIFHNDWTGIRNEDNVDYDVEMRLAGAPVFQAHGVHQYTFSTWHHLIWTDGKPSVRVVADLATLAEAAAVPRYQTDFAIAREIANKAVDAGNDVSDKPMQSGMIDHHMPDAGGRWDIGPLPTWAVIDLMKSNEATRKLLMANADAAGAVPWHLRDRKTGLPLTIDAHPGTWLDSRGEGTVKEGVLPEVFQGENHGWTLDDAHQPSLTYLPYLLTGSQYYRDELAAQAAYVLLSYDAGYRGGSHGLIIGENGQAWQQVRGMAWSLRTIAGAAFILPTTYPLRGYFDAKLKGNLAKLVQIFVQDRKMKAAGPLEGWVIGDYGTPGITAPWQQGFLATVLSWANDMGYPDAGRLVTWMSNFLAGLFTSADQGFDPSRGPAYNLMVFDPDSGKLINNWGEAYSRSQLGDKNSKEVEEQWQDYGRIMQAALAGAYSINPTPRLQKAYEYALTRSNGLAWSFAKGDPTFAIVARPAPAPGR